MSSIEEYEIDNGLLSLRTQSFLQVFGSPFTDINELKYEPRIPDAATFKSLVDQAISKLPDLFPNLDGTFVFGINSKPTGAPFIISCRVRIGDRYINIVDYKQAVMEVPQFQGLLELVAFVRSNSNLVRTVAAGVKVKSYASEEKRAGYFRGGCLAVDTHLAPEGDVCICYKALGDFSKDPTYSISDTGAIHNVVVSPNKHPALCDAISISLETALIVQKVGRLISDDGKYINQLTLLDQTGHESERYNETEKGITVRFHPKELLFEYQVPENNHVGFMNQVDAREPSVISGPTHEFKHHDPVTLIDYDYGQSRKVDMNVHGTTHDYEFSGKACTVYVRDGITVGPFNRVENATKDAYMRTDKFDPVLMEYTHLNMTETHIMPFFYNGGGNTIGEGSPIVIGEGLPPGEPLSLQFAQTFEYIPIVEDQSADYTFPDTEFVSGPLKTLLRSEGFPVVVNGNTFFKNLMNGIHKGASKLRGFLTDTKLGKGLMTAGKVAMAL